MNECLPALCKCLFCVVRRRKSRKGPTKSIVCTPNSLKLDNKCYIFSKTKANFYDASQDCRANNSKLAVLKSRKQDHQLRAFLNSKATSKLIFLYNNKVAYEDEFRARGTMDIRNIRLEGKELENNHWRGAEVQRIR